MFQISRICNLMKPNILFLVYDMFKADKCYGKEKTSLTPNLDSLIEKGAYFEQAISSSDMTVPAIGAVFTGLYSIKSGIYGKKGFINENIIDCIQILKQNEYSIYMTVPDTNFYRKLAGYADTNFKSFPPVGKLSLLHNGIGENILKTLEKKMNEPWFYYIHLMDLHLFPTVPNPEFDNEKFGSNHYERMLSQMDVWLGKILQKIDLKNTLIILIGDHGQFSRTVSKGEKTRVSNKKIDGSSIHTKTLAKKIKPLTPKFLQNVGKNILIKLTREIQFAKVKLQIRSLTLSQQQKRILTGVQGDIEALLYDDLIRVPLIFSGYGIPAGKIISKQVGTIDIFPTIFELIKIEKIIKNTDGLSLTPFFRGKEINERPIFLQSGSMYDIEKGYLIGARTSNFKFFLQNKNSKLKRYLFDLNNDPFEFTNIIDENPAISAELEKFVEKIQKDARPDTAEEINKAEKEELEKELRKLGYV